jgi:hypothetical protein
MRKQSYDLACVPGSRSKTIRKCDRHHKLAAVSTDLVGYTCNVCSRDDIPKGARIWNCTPCDYDLCDVCYNGGNTNTTATTTPTTTATPTTTTTPTITVATKRKRTTQPTWPKREVKKKEEEKEDEVEEKGKLIAQDGMLDGEKGGVVEEEEEEEEKEVDKLDEEDNLWKFAWKKSVQWAEEAEKTCRRLAERQAETEAELQRSQERHSKEMKQARAFYGQALQGEVKRALAKQLETETRALEKQQELESELKRMRAELQSLRNKQTVLSESMAMKQERIEEAEESKECKICLDEQATVAVQPCGHLCLCRACVQLPDTLTNGCPICRGAVDATTNIFV